jgi:putative phosphoesterase
LPVTRRVELDGLKFYLVHATPRDPFDEYLRDDEEGWLARLESVEADFICVGHSHQPFCLDLGDRKVINPGSVGQPRDGDPRASYCVIDDGQVTFHRVEYDIEATIQNLSENGIAGEVLEMAAHFLRTGGRMLP